MSDFSTMKYLTKNYSVTILYAIIDSVCSVIILALIGIHFSTGNTIFLFEAETLRSTYGFLIGSTFSGVIGTGFYPILGNRVWCRFGCPMAAIMGMQQRFFSKFRITTNGGQCISCGNCSTYCEMGIDVKAYAQKGQNIVRSSSSGVTTSSNKVSFICSGEDSAAESASAALNRTTLV